MPSHLPVAVKLTPYLSSIGHFAETLVNMARPDWCCSTGCWSPTSTCSRMKLTDTLELSDPDEMRLPMLWIAILAGRIKASLAASAGVSRRRWRREIPCLPAPMW